MENKPKIIALVPAYNEERKIAEVVRAASRHLPVWVIDDGSKDGTATAAQEAGAVVLRQTPNQGKGNALKLGFRQALAAGVKAVITLDADGQHDPQEIPQFLGLYASQPAELIIGSRQFERMPLVRRIANTSGNILMSWALRTPILDNQSGYRLIGQRLMSASLTSPLSGYEFEVDVLRLCLHNGWGLRWLPIQTIYADEKSSIKPFRHAWGFIRLALQIRMGRFG